MIRLRQIKGADRGREFEFDQELIRIGRMPDSDVDFDPEVDLDASGRHAEIRSESGRYLLVDTGSRNGTWLNGQRIKHAALGPGDEIEFGRGGPKLEIHVLQSGPGASAASGLARPETPRRSPRFDPLAMPVTTATRLDDFARHTDLVHGTEEQRRSAAPRRQQRRRARALLWTAVGVLLSAAVIMVALSLRESLF